MYNRDKFGLEPYYPETPRPKGYLGLNEEQAKKEDRERNNLLFWTMNCSICILTFVAPLIWILLEALLIIWWICNRLAIEFQ